MKLLIADDNPGFRKVLKNFCEEYFHEIIECEDGDEAIYIHKKERPDWIFMDIKMNRMDGLTATRNIIIDNPDARIIIISQFNDKDTIKASKESGAVEFVNKEDLTMIEEILKENC
jgi:CheY-like chemotaxis protein